MSFLYWRPVVSLCLSVRPCQTSQALWAAAKTLVKDYQILDTCTVFKTNSTMLFLLCCNSTMTSSCKTVYGITSAPHLSWGITVVVVIAGNTGLGQQWSMHFEICLPCATAPMCMFWFFVCLSEFHFIWFKFFFVLFLHFYLSFFD